MALQAFALGKRAPSEPASFACCRSLWIVVPLSFDRHGGKRLPLLHGSSRSSWSTGSRESRCRGKVQGKGAVASGGCTLGAGARCRGKAQGEGAAASGGFTLAQAHEGGQQQVADLVTPPPHAWPHLAPPPCRPPKGPKGGWQSSRSWRTS